MNKCFVYWPFISSVVFFSLVACAGNGVLADNQSVDNTSSELSSSSGKKISSSSELQENSSSVKSSLENPRSSSDKNISSSSKEELSSSSKSRDVNENCSSSVEKKTSSCSRNIVSTESSSSVGFAERLIDVRDNQTYDIVTVGSQTWMSKNLNYKVENSYCYNDSLEYCEKYGRLYTWAAAVGKSEEECGYQKNCAISGSVQGICPSGWHIPSKTEWEMLFETVGGQSIAGKELKSTSGWHNDYNGSGVYGFSVFPIGYRDYDGGFLLVNEYAGFWTSTKYNEEHAYFIYFYFYDDKIFQSKNFKDFGFAVRCVKN